MMANENFSTANQLHITRRRLADGHKPVLRLIALVNVQQTGASEAELRERLQAARNALELSTLRYQSGYSPYLEVLDAQRTANDAELAFVRNRQARLAFSVDLMKALGGGWK